MIKFSDPSNLVEKLQEKGESKEWSEVVAAQVVELRTVETNELGLNPTG